MLPGIVELDKMYKNYLLSRETLAWKEMSCVMPDCYLRFQRLLLKLKYDKRDFMVSFIPVSWHNNNI